MQETSMDVASNVFKFIGNEINLMHLEIAA